MEKGDDVKKFNIGDKVGGRRRLTEDCWQGNRRRAWEDQAS